MKHSVSLEIIRKTEGIKRLEHYVKNLIDHDKRAVISLLNEDTLSYPTIYVLSPTIREHNLSKHLSDRNRIALSIQKDILSKERAPAAPFPYSICDLPQYIHSVLRWMVETGSEEKLNTRYRLVIDRAAGLLTTIYQHPDDLLLVSKLLFNRKRAGLSTHYVTWAYFSSHNIASLLPIGEKLLSADEEEVAFARELLHFITGLDESDDPYAYFRSWYEENLPYLLHNENSYELTAELAPYVVDHDTKYRECFSHKASSDLREDGFHSLSEQEKEQLANLSYKIRMRSRSEWIEWMNRPLSAQLMFMEEVQHDHDSR
ncbi:hypothetical protein [Pseudalkalibacillus hwajinpoensis]|uniref:hypothetical protein n=1 Tax=Guptibacillus hwajinpoensis TaxID=208199 RepID=UPI001CD704E7|nr:hypothetical protein [Pseudalkalibacillus hwajinpoensis]MCA0993270.1 hypothetical protein [Pseudalkalibacillus hwajinpoensis]